MTQVDKKVSDLKDVAAVSAMLVDFTPEQLLNSLALALVALAQEEAEHTLTKEALEFNARQTMELIGDMPLSSLIGTGVEIS